MNNNKQKGFGLLEVLGALVVGSMLFGGYARMASEAQKQTRDTVTAQHFKAVSDASTRYIQDNWSAIQAAATPTVPVVVTTAMLTSTGYLPAGFSSTNPYNQTLRTEILEPSAGNLQATVISMNGTTIPAGQAPRIAAKVGAGGGYTPTATPTTAQGAFGGWSMPLVNITRPGAGHLVGLLYFNNGQLISDYLRRHSVPGHPEVNQMFTTLDMNGQTLNNANQVNSTTMTASQTVTAGGGNVHLKNQAGEGGVVRLTGANGQNVHLENINGTFRTLNHPWSMETWSVDQGGNTHNPGWANVDGAVRTQYLSDSNNTGYYVDPNGTSRTNYTVQDNNYINGWNQADIYYDRFNNGYYMQPRGTNRLNYIDADNQLTRGYHGADTFYDRYNNNYYAQFRGTNRLNYIDADRQLTRGINEANAFKVNYIASAGASCAGNNGGIVQDGTGALLNCRSGVWVKIGSVGTTLSFRTTFAPDGSLINCPSGYVLSGLTQIEGGNIDWIICSLIQ